VITVIHYPDDIRPARWHQPVLALGNFDGMHRGHLKIIERVRRGANERGATSVAMTFDPHPSKIVRPDKAALLLMTNAQKIEALSRAGMDGVAIIRFTPELALWDPETFVQRVLVEWLHVAEVWVGANFLFGHDRSGNFSLLRSLGARYGFRAEKIDPVRYREFVVSSTRVRRLITEGRVDEAGALLGHHYAIDGSVIHGQHRGQSLGVPTANLCTGNELIPPQGVYATIATIDGVAYPSMTNIGRRPTFEEAGEMAIESHILGFDKDIYGASLNLAFVQRLRDEKAFDGADALKAQLELDRTQARGLFDRMGL
jgi:riboflavin kinase/FMN adenylyltransferase